MSIYDVSKV